MHFFARVQKCALFWSSSTDLRIFRPLASLSSISFICYRECTILVKANRAQDFSTLNITLKHSLTYTRNALFWSSSAEQEISGLWTLRLEYPPQCTSPCPFKSTFLTLSLIHMQTKIAAAFITSQATPLAKSSTP